MSRTYFWLPVSTLVALFASAAHATSDFPPVIAATLGLSSAPPCVLCHATELGGNDSVVRPVGRRVQNYGLMAYDVPTLTKILGQMRDGKDDSDQDGMSDVDELKAGRDPNINDITGEPPEDYPPPVYGCHAGGGHARRIPHNVSWAAVAAGLVGILGLRSRLQQRRAVPVRRKDV